MNDIKVKARQREYSVIFFENCLESIESLFDREIGLSRESKIMFVIDRSIFDCYSHKIELLKKLPNIFTYIVDAGGDSKNLEVANRIYGVLIENGFLKTDLIVGLGGGVVGDLTGFVASTYYRGMRFALIPTTLLSQVDSSIGGKNALHVNKIVNAVGTVYPPHLVVIDLGFLKTLDMREISCGYGEIIKIASLHDREMYKGLLLGDTNEVGSLIHHSIVLKKNIVEEDEFEAGHRKSLNFGHTLGHALESLVGHSNLRHGEAVALGCLFEFYLSVVLGKIDEMELHIFIKILEKYRLNNLDDLIKTYGHMLSSESLLEKMLKDKKNTQEKIHFTLPTLNGYEFLEVNHDDISIKNALNNFLEVFVIDEYTFSS